MDLFWKAIINRFLKAFALSAVSAMLIIVPMGMTDWQDLTQWLNSLALAGVFAGITGLLQALEKALRWKE